MSVNPATPPPVGQGGPGPLKSGSPENPIGAAGRAEKKLPASVPETLRPDRTSSTSLDRVKDFTAELDAILRELEGEDPLKPSGALFRLKEQVSLMGQGVISLSFDRYAQAIAYLPKLLALQNRYVSSYPSKASEQISERIDREISALQSACAVFIDTWNGQMTSEIKHAREHLEQAYHVIFDELAADGTELMGRQREVYEQVELLRYLESACREAVETLRGIKQELLQSEQKWDAIEDSSWISKMRKVVSRVFSRGTQEAESPDQLAAQGDSARTGRSSVIGNRLINEIDNALMRLEESRSELSPSFADLNGMLEGSTVKCFEALEWLGAGRKEIMGDLMEETARAGTHYSRNGALQIERRARFLRYMAEQCGLPLLGHSMDERLKREMEFIGGKLDEIVPLIRSESGVLTENGPAIHHLVMGDGRFALLGAAAIYSLFANAVQARDDEAVQFMVSTGNLENQMVQDTLLPLFSDALDAGDRELGEFILKEMPVTEESFYPGRVLLPHAATEGKGGEIALYYGMGTQARNSSFGDAREVSEADYTDQYVCDRLLEFFYKPISARSALVNAAVDEMSQRDIEYCEKLKTLKFLSHSWEVGGEVMIEGPAQLPASIFDILLKPVALEKDVRDEWGVIVPKRLQPERANMVLHRWELDGSFPELALKDMLESVRSFSSAYPGAFRTGEINAITSLLERGQAYASAMLEPSTEEDSLKFNRRESDPEPIYNDYKSGLPVLISTGFTGHNIAVLLHGDYLLIGNKGGSIRQPLEAYRINKEKVTSDTIYEILDMKVFPSSHYVKWLENLSDHFEVIAGDPLAAFINAAYPMQFGNKQITGNCAYESPETALYGMLLLERLSEDFDPAEIERNFYELAATVNDFGLWDQFTKLYTLDSYFDAAGIDVSAPPEAAELSQTADMGVLQTTFERALDFDWNPDLQTKLDAMEKIYMGSLNDFQLGGYLTEKVARRELMRTNEEIFRAGNASLFGGQALDSSELLGWIYLVPMTMRLVKYATRKFFGH